MERDRSATYQHQFSNFHQSPFRPPTDSPSPYSTRPFDMKQSMSDFSTTHGHDPESATIDAVVAHPNDTELDPAEQNARPSLLARAHRLIPNSIYCRLYLLTVLVEAAVDVVIEGVLYLKMRDYYEGLSTSEKAKDDLSVKRLPVYLGIFAFAHVYQFVLAMFAVHQRNTMQFMFLALFNLLLLVYSIIQIYEIGGKAETIINQASLQTVKVLTTSIPCVIAFAQIVYAALAWKIYEEFGWKVYKLLGADRLVKKMYAHYLFYECLIKFDGFFWVGFSVQYLILVLNPNDVEYYLTLVMTPGCFIVLLVGHLAARHENKWMMISFFIGCLAALIYFSYKLFRIWSQRTFPQYSGVFKSHTIFAAISILFLLITFAWGVLVWNNFGKGLKKQMDKADHAKKQAESAGLGGHKRTGTNVSSYMMNGTGPKRNNRMSIE
ncbi:hypothetical protein FS749_002791 [Ceratobasidium sp. UAMH 11750]|nr:hypothetical protein FS749_002791 [Ceratobasidium sp. UAMH 11750]